MRSLTVSRPAVTGRSMMLIGVMAVAVLWNEQIVAAPKTDVVVLINGDRITGEVKDLERGILKYSTDFMGTLSIEWDKVVQLRSDQLLEVGLLDGTRTLGRPKQLDERGAMRLQADGDETVVWLESVSRIFAIDTGRLRDRLDGYYRNVRLRPTARQSATRPTFKRGKRSMRRARGRRKSTTWFGRAIASPVPVASCRPWPIPSTSPTPRTPTASARPSWQPCGRIRTSIADELEETT